MAQATQMKIDQATLAPAGTAGKARTDGKSGGQLVTLTNTGSGSTTRFRLLDVALGDTTAVSSLVQTLPKVWTFSPTAARYGTYLCELIEDEGLPTEKREQRVFGIRLPISGLLIPGLNEIGDPTASLVNAGAGPIAAAVNNADDYTSNANLNTRRYAAWWRMLAELHLKVEAGGVPSNTSEKALVAGNQNTDQLTFQSIGGIKLTATEATSLAACVFRVVAFATSAADACEVRLFNVTDAAVVASSTLSFTNTTSAELTAAIAIPAGAKVYEVQMRLATTGSPNRGVVLGARLTPS